MSKRDLALQFPYIEGKTNIKCTENTLSISQSHLYPTM